MGVKYKKQKEEEEDLVRCLFATIICHRASAIEKALTS